jgi:hypothetical protein
MFTCESLYLSLFGKAACELLSLISFSDIEVSSARIAWRLLQCRPSYLRIGINPDFISRISLDRIDFIHGRLHIKGAGLFISTDFMQRDLI